MTIGPSTNRHRKGGRVDYRTAERGPNGRLLCRWCRAEVSPPRRTFCSAECVHEHRIRTDAMYVRIKVYERDKGVCALCAVDTGARRARGSGHLWQADHIVPVVEGGGECGLDNLRTLCTSCHKRVTAELAARRAAVRRSA